MRFGFLKVLFHSARMRRSPHLYQLGKQKCKGSNLPSTRETRIYCKNFKVNFTTRDVRAIGWKAFSSLGFLVSGWVLKWMLSRLEAFGRSVNPQRTGPAAIIMFPVMNRQWHIPEISHCHSEVQETLSARRIFQRRHVSKLAKNEWLVFRSEYSNPIHGLFILIYTLINKFHCFNPLPGFSKDPLCYIVFLYFPFGTLAG